MNTSMHEWDFIGCLSNNCKSKINSWYTTHLYYHTHAVYKYIVSIDIQSCGATLPTSIEHIAESRGTLDVKKMVTVLSVTIGESWMNCNSTPET